MVSVDPKRVYVSNPDDFSTHWLNVATTSTLPIPIVVALRPNEKGPLGETYCWWQCTVKGGRETRNLCAVRLAQVRD